MYKCIFLEVQNEAVAKYDVYLNILLMVSIYVINYGLLNNPLGVCVSELGGFIIWVVDTDLRVSDCGL